MAEYLIRGGTVYDPLNGVDGERVDIAVRDGKVVKGVSGGATVVDASRMVVMPGGWIFTPISLGLRLTLGAS